jgi:pimeloyl-ACP methyl ester carboxylesterase
MQFPELVYDFDFSIVELDEKISIAFTDTGNKECENVLLFIHGLSSYIPAWSKLIPLLQNNFRCIAIDLPGYGKSSAGVHSGTSAFYSENISKFIQKLELKNVTLVGHSMGGQIAAFTSIKFPEQINKLIFLAPAGFETFTNEEIKRLQKNNIPEYYSSFSNKQININFAANFFRMPDDVMSMIEDRINMKDWKNFYYYCEIVANSLNDLIINPVINEIHLIKQNTLIIYGMDDRFIPQPVLHNKLTVKSVAEEGASKMRNSKLIFINECGHFLQFEKPLIIAQEISNFFKYFFR